MSPDVQAWAPEGEAREVDGFVRLRLRGPVTGPKAPEIRERLRQCLALGRTRVLVDLRAVTFVDPRGIAALLEGARMIEQQGNGALLLRVNRIVSRALRDAGAGSRFKVWSGRPA